MSGVIVYIFVSLRVFFRKVNYWKNFFNLDLRDWFLGGFNFLLRIKVDRMKLRRIFIVGELFVIDDVFIKLVLKIVRFSFKFIGNYIVLLFIDWIVCWFGFGCCCLDINVIDMFFFLKFLFLIVEWFFLIIKMIILFNCM